LENVVEEYTISFTDIVKQQLDEEMLKNVGKTVKKEVNESLEKVSDNIHEVQAIIHETKIQAAEKRDHESRRNNIILYRVPEVMRQAMKRGINKMWHCLRTGDLSVVSPIPLLSVSVSVSLCFNGHFLGEHGLAGVY